LQVINEARLVFGGEIGLDQLEQRVKTIRPAVDLGLQQVISEQ